MKRRAKNSPGGKDAHRRQGPTSLRGSMGASQRDCILHSCHGRDTKSANPKPCMHASPPQLPSPSEISLCHQIRFAVALRALALSMVRRLLRGWDRDPYPLSDATVRRWLLPALR